MTDESTSALIAARAAEKEQSLFYRMLAVQADLAGDAALVERLSELHADEQHHFARISARLVELGVTLPTVAQEAERVQLGQWEAAAREREQREIARYEQLLALELDEATRAVIEETLGTERHHAGSLAGKWTQA